jgi:Domain of unknown function (DUF4376)
MPLDLSGLITEDPNDADNYKFVVVGPQKGWLPLSQSDSDQKAADATAAQAAIPVQLRAYTADKRRRLVDAGTEVAVTGQTIPAWTDAASQGAITALVVASQHNEALSVGWKGSDGNFYTINAAQMLELAFGMLAFVQSCFVAEAAVLAAIQGGTITSFAEIDAASWPE